MNHTATARISAVLGLVFLTSCNAPGLSRTVGYEPTEPSAPRSTSSSGSANANLATPIADSPAAGICGKLEGEIVTMTINPDMPDPRCLQVRSGQRLRVVNQRGEPLEVTLGQTTASLQPGEETIFERTFGELLLPGVHALQVSPCCGGEIVLNQ